MCYRVKLGSEHLGDDTYYIRRIILTMLEFDDLASQVFKVIIHLLVGKCMSRYRSALKKKKKVLKLVNKSGSHRETKANA